MFTYIPVTEDALEITGAGISNRGRKPYDLIETLHAFLNSGDEYAELTGWEDRYNSSHSFYTGVTNICRRHNIPIEVIYRGGRIYIRNINF